MVSTIPLYWFWVSSSFARSSHISSSLRAEPGTYIMDVSVGEPVEITLSGRRNPTDGDGCPVGDAVCEVVGEAVCEVVGEAVGEAVGEVVGEVVPPIVGCTIVGCCTIVG